jgi:hypothetical protein
MRAVDHDQVQQDDALSYSGSNAARRSGSEVMTARAMPTP